MRMCCMRFLQKNKVLDARMFQNIHTGPQSALDGGLSAAVQEFKEIEDAEEFLLDCQKLITINNIMHSFFHLVSFLASLARRIHQPRRMLNGQGDFIGPSTFVERMMSLPRVWKVWKELRVFKVKAHKAMKLIEKYRQEELF